MPSVGGGIPPVAAERGRAAKAAVHMDGGLPCASGPSCQRTYTFGLSLISLVGSGQQSTASLYTAPVVLPGYGPFGKRSML